jgi:hypothetical protein
MSRRTQLLSLSLAGAAAVAWILFAVGAVGLGSGDRTERRASRATPPVEPPAKARSPHVPLEPAVAEAPEDETDRPTSEASVPPPEWPPALAFTERCRAQAGKCPAGCTELAGGRCLDPCFIHTAECSRDCRLPDGTCGFPPRDSE